MASPTAVHPAQVDLFFVDTETGSLDGRTGEVLEVAAIRTDPTGTTILDRYTARVLVDPKKVDPAAAAINGYDAQLWAETAVDRRHVVLKLARLAERAILVAHRAEFDWPFIEAMFQREDVRWPGRYFRCCTAMLAWPLLMTADIPNAKLATLIQHFGLEQAEAHRAESDVDDCRRVYIEIMKMWSQLPVLTLSQEIAS